MSIFKSIQSWANGLVNKWEEESKDLAGHEAIIIRRKGGSIFPEMVNYAPMPRVKLTEPVELIIKAMKERPETFEIGYTFWDIATRSREVKISDTVTGLTLLFNQSSWGYNDGFKCTTDLWITENDTKAIKEQIDVIQSKKQETEMIAQAFNIEQQRLKVVEMYKGQC